MKMLKCTNERRLWVDEKKIIAIMSWPISSWAGNSPIEQPRCTVFFSDGGECGFVVMGSAESVIESLGLQ